MGLHETSVVLAVLSASRNISWTQQIYTAFIALSGTGSGAPAAANAGIDLQDTVKGLVAVYTREEVHRRTARYTVPIHDAATTYSVSIGGTVVNHVAGGDTRADQALRGLLVSMLASGPITTLVSAIVVNAAGVDVTSTAFDGTDSATITATSATAILIRGIAEDDYTIDKLVAGGTGTSAVVADPISCSMRIYATRNVSAGAAQWLLINDGKEFIDRRGWTERLTINGYRRLYVEIYDCAATGDGTTITYAPGVFLGPALLES